MTLFAFAGAYVGFAALAVAMDRHHRQVWHRIPRTGFRVTLRVLGACWLEMSLVACILQSGWSFGFVLWFAILAASGISLIVLLSYNPRLALAGTLMVIPTGIAAVLPALPPS